MLAGAGLLSAGIGAIGATSAASTEANAANQASQVQQAEFAQTQQNLAPYINQGPGALNSLQSLVSGGPQAAAQLSQTPGYQFQLQQGLQALLDSRSATGGVGGGNTLKALTQYGQGLAGSTYEQQINNLMGLTNLGESAAAGQGQLGAQVAQGIGSNITGAGNASAAGTIGATNAIGGGINNISSNYLLASLLGGGGGGFGAGAAGAGITGLTL